ncbi:MAG: M23 family metallopeptidase [Gemmatimonadaceae bacterium]
MPTDTERPHTPSRGRPARAITYGVVALLAFAAVYTMRPLSATPKAAEQIVARPESNRPAPWKRQVDTLGRGESLAALLERVGVPDVHAQEVIRQAALDDRRIPAGMEVAVFGPADSMPAEVEMHPSIDRIVRVKRTPGGWVGSEEKLAWHTDTVAVHGTISSSLFQAIDAGAPEFSRPARADLAYTLADIFEYRVDMSRDLQVGDAFQVLVEREVAPNGLTKVGRVLAAKITLSGSELGAFQYLSSELGSRGYYDQNGKSLRASFLRAPLEFRRISSVFGGRFHPILGRWKFHKGTDYAAASGTPVRAIGDGVVIKAGWTHGYGNTLEIRHRGGLVTRYGHLRGFASGVRSGVRVEMGKTVAYVGSTGLSTGPHLHFEVLVNGVQQDPRVALSTKGGEPLPAGERGRFANVRSELLSMLDVRARAGN